MWPALLLPVRRRRFPSVELLAARLGSVPGLILRVLVYGLGGAAFLLARSSGLTGNNMREQLIQHDCFKSLNAEMTASGKPASAGMPEFACNCLVQHVDARASIPQAQAIGKDQAIEKFNLAQ